MSKRKTIFLWSFVVALGILLWGATGIAHNSLHDKKVQPEITASPDVKLSEPEPQITAAADAKLEEPEPTIEALPAPPTAPDNIPFESFTSTPQYVGPVAPNQSPYTPAQPPLSGPQRPPVAPILPVPVQPLPPVVTGPVEGLLEPLAPVTDPLLGTVDKLLPLPQLPILPKVDIHVGLHP